MKHNTCHYLDKELLCIEINVGIWRERQIYNKVDQISVIFGKNHDGLSRVSPKSLCIIIQENIHVESFWPNSAGFGVDALPIHSLNIETT